MLISCSHLESKRVQKEEVKKEQRMNLKVGK